MAGRGSGEAQGAGTDQEREGANAPSTRKFRRSSPSSLSQRGEGKGEREVGSGPNTLPSAFEEITGILDLFGLRSNHRDPAINPIWEAQKLGQLLF